MNEVLKIALILVAFLVTPPVAYPQPILIGCTGAVNSMSPPSRIVDLNLTTGAATNARNTGISVLGGIAMQPSTGTIFGLTTFASSPANSLVTLSLSTGGFTLVGPTGLNPIVEGDLAFNPLDGLLYGVQDLGPMVNQRNLFRMNPATGIATFVGSLNSAGDYSALAFDPLGTLFAIDTAGLGNSLLNTVNPSNGSITTTTILNADLGDGAGLAFDPMTGSAYVTNSGQGITSMLFSLDIGSGTLSPIGPTGIAEGISGLTFVAVPEPTSILLVGLAALVANISGTVSYFSRRGIQHVNNVERP